MKAYQWTEFSLSGVEPESARVTNELIIDEMVGQIIARRQVPRSLGGWYFSSGQSFKSLVEGEFGVRLRPDVVKGISTESNTFKVISTGEVGESRVEIMAVIDYTNNQTGQILYWAIR